MHCRRNMQRFLLGRRQGYLGWCDRNSTHRVSANGLSTTILLLAISIGFLGVSGDWLGSGDTKPAPVPGRAGAHYARPGQAVAPQPRSLRFARAVFFPEPPKSSAGGRGGPARAFNFGASCLLSQDRSSLCAPKFRPAGRRLDHERYDFGKFSLATFPASGFRS